MARKEGRKRKEGRGRKRKEGRKEEEGRKREIYTDLVEIESFLVKVVCTTNPIFAGRRKISQIWGPIFNGF